VSTRTHSQTSRARISRTWAWRCRPAPASAVRSPTRAPRWRARPPRCRTRVSPFPCYAAAQAVRPAAGSTGMRVSDRLVHRPIRRRDRGRFGVVIPHDDAGRTGEDHVVGDGVVAQSEGRFGRVEDRADDPLDRRREGGWPDRLGDRSGRRRPSPPRMRPRPPVAVAARVLSSTVPGVPPPSPRPLSRGSRPPREAPTQP
jgi:hypothetical protein